METVLGRFAAQVERPEPTKFAWPIMLIPEMFTTRRHQAILIGFLATIGWEVYAPDLRSAAGRDGTPALGRLSFEQVAAIAGEALDAIGREAIVVGHGFGGLVALKMAERARVKASVALAPMIPGVRTPLFMRAGNLPAMWLKRPLKPPRGRPLFHMLTDVEPFQREALIKALVPDASVAALEIVRGAVRFAADVAVPRLIVAGGSDPLVSAERLESLAGEIGAAFKSLPGQGHWLIGGRAAERAVGEVHRFLVRALGQELLLLYPEEWRDEPASGD
ncbi:MAG: alpha/beta hydrolase [Xanthobacteraceae bacterium]